MRNSYIAEHILNMPPSGIRKFFDVASTMDDVISLGVGEPDFETPWHIREAAISSIEKGITSYTSNQGLFQLREEVCKYLADRYDINYNPDTQVVITVGASEGIDIACRALLNPGDEVLLVEPSYVSYKPCITMAGGVPVVIETKNENQFRLMPEELEAAITPKTKLLILPYPNNPTGGIMEKEDLERISSILIENDIFVISDEIYSELTYGRNHVSMASLPGMYERTVVLNGFSKSYAMTGWRLGYAAGPDEIIKYMNRIHQYIIMCAPTMSQYAAVEALSNPKSLEDIAYMRDCYDERRALMVSRFRQMGLECFEPLGAFYVFPCIKSTGLSSSEFCEKLLYEYKVAVVPGTAFGACGEGFIRCSYAYAIDDIKTALDIIQDFVTSLK